MVLNGIGVRPDTNPNALGKCWDNYLYNSIPKRPVYADKLLPKCPETHCIVQDWGKMGLNFSPVITVGVWKFSSQQHWAWDTQNTESLSQAKYYDCVQLL